MFGSLKRIAAALEQLVVIEERRLEVREKLYGHQVAQLRSADAKDDAIRQKVEAEKRLLER